LVAFLTPIASPGMMDPSVIDRVVIDRFGDRSSRHEHRAL
jgi:hypothetical protein